MPGIFVGAKAFLICRPLPLAQGAVSATGGAPIAPPLAPQRISSRKAAYRVRSTYRKSLQGIYIDSLPLQRNGKDKLEYVGFGMKFLRRIAKLAMRLFFHYRKL